MKVKLDENLGRSAVEMLARAREAVEMTQKRKRTLLAFDSTRLP